ncbi:MAG: hypothetical protein MMC23_002145 [Stictis urceolatum]|nr:hypothetical protein [Stictis urceolata]
MPRGRPPKARQTSTARQPPLSFSKKVTKPGSKSSALSKTAEAKAQKLLSETELTPVASPTPESPTSVSVELDPKVDEEPTTADLAIREQTLAEKEQTERSAEEEEALGVSEARVKKYWKAKEDSRISPRVHQEGMTLHDKVLREFDLSSHFGPCIGIARTKRWKRANKLGLNPPIEILAVLLKEDALNNAKVQRAYVDELMSSKTLVE